MRKTYLIICLASFFALSYFPNRVSGQQNPPSAENVESLKDLQELKNIIDKLEVTTNALIEGKYYDCLKAFGHARFCTCLKEKTPIGISFQTYIRIITANKSDLRYQQLSDEDKKMVDVTYKARDNCVASTISR